MAKYIFFGLFLPLFVSYTLLAFSHKSLKIYLTGVFMSLLYFLAGTEGIVYVYCNKIPLVGFLVNPYQGAYRPLLLNYHYNKVYFWIVLGSIFVFFIYLLIVLKLNGTTKDKLQNTTAKSEIN